MRFFVKALGILGVMVALAAAGGLTYFMWRYPEVSPPRAVSLPTNPDVVARGEYLVHHVFLCLDCHSERDFSRFAGPIKPETLGAGGERFDLATAGVPGVIYTPNITPAGIGQWSDGEVLRAVTDGISRDGHALFPAMPYANFSQLAEDDVLAALAYIRTLKPIAAHHPARTLDFPMNLIVRTIPRKATFGTRPSPSDRVAYGKYLVTAASCSDCHTPIDNQGQPLPGRAFAGGVEFQDPETGYRMRTANITPDADTGIGTWTEEQFVNKFKGFETPDDRVLSDTERRQNSAMPWRQYAGMTREDLGAIYQFLRTQTPVVHRVEKWPDQKAPPQ